MKKKYLPYFVFVAWQATVLSIYSDFIYNVDFEDPPHAIGSAPVTGAGSDRPTDHNGFGWTISSGVADFSSQVAVVGGSGYEYMSFDPVPTLDTAINIISWELAILLGDTDPQANMTVEPVDGPSPVAVVFNGNGDVYISDPVSGSTTVGTWAQNVSAQYSLALDLDANTYDFFIDSSQVVFDQSFGVATEISHVNFFRPFDSASYAIDNFQWQIIPEPSTVGLLIMGGIGLSIARFSRRCSSRRKDRIRQL